MEFPVVQTATTATNTFQNTDQANEAVTDDEVQSGVTLSDDEDYSTTTLTKIRGESQYSSAVSLP